MKKFLHRLIKFFAYCAGGIVILLAIAVGLFRLFLPRLPAYQDEIKAWTSEAFGMQVEFSGMDARWGLSGPELEFYNAELIRPDSEIRVISAQEVRVGVGLVRLLVDRTLVVDRIVVRNSGIDVQQLGDGSFRIQGSDVSELLNLRPKDADKQVNVEFVGEDLELRFVQPGDERPRFFSIPRIRVSIDDKRIAADAAVRLPDDLGRALNISATQLLTLPISERSWDISVEADEISLPGWSSLSTDSRQFTSGGGDVDMALSLTNSRLTNVTAELDFADIALSNDAPFAATGRVEVNIASDGWLVAANDFVVTLTDHAWPETSIRVEAGIDAEGQVVMLDMQASYVNLDDLQVINPWLTDKQQQTVAQFAPSGVVRDLVATVSEINSDAPAFNVAAELDRVGVAQAEQRPGVRGFSGSLNANRDGGLLEMDSTDLQIDLAEYIREPIALNTARGTVIWRSSMNGTTILSDSIRIDSDVFESQSNVHLTIDGDGSSPEIDLASRWSITDVAAAKRLIPHKIVKPKLHDWFQTALVSGSIPNGTTELNGPLDKFPFDGGEGRLLIEASARNMTFKYHRDWPAAEQADIDVIVDNARLYTRHNNSTSIGNSVVDAKVDIEDVRDPVLKIESFSTGSLESIRQFSLQSPIAKVFGGQLDRVSVSGDASFSLDLTVPLKNLNAFEFVTRVRSNSGTLSVEGFAPPVTDLIGEVTLRRDQISSESLGGQFLGQAIDIQLARSDDPQFAVVATVDGIITSDGVISDLGAPLDGLVDGAAPYQARVLFPDSKAEAPSPLTIQIETNFEGFAFDFPEPVGKEHTTPFPVAGDIRFLPGGEVIESAGIAASGLAWQLAFNRPEEAWDLDRGVLSLGGEEIAPADTRGLHIRGATSVVRLDDWLNLSRSGEDKVGAAERIRSVDLQVDDLYIVGQHLQGHRIRVDRSALDWLVQFEGDDVQGSVFVPYDFGGDRAMVLDMERLHMPGDDTAGDSPTIFDPRNLPPITLSADAFAFGDRHLGAVDATLEKIENGLAATTIHSKDDSFEIAGSGRWVADVADPLESHSFITATLTSTDVVQTMSRLNYQPGIKSSDMRMSFDLDWSGSPRADFFDVLDGDVEVFLGKGQLEEVEPGAGRMFGLMSIVALPRRLSLDFRDVFSKGFGFDKIAGSFRIVNGKTYTCDLSLEGPAADIGIVGEADLANRTYDQTAIVSANVGNTLPIVGAVVAGPQVAAAMLIFSQIFKKPLQEVGQVYYSIGGSWDAAAVDSTNSDAFVRSSELAGCLNIAEQSVR